MHSAIVAGPVGYGYTNPLTNHVSYNMSVCTKNREAFEAPQPDRRDFCCLKLKSKPGGAQVLLVETGTVNR